MDTTSIKTEPNFEDVKIKIEPDDPDSSYGCLFIKDEFDIKIEIKEEDLDDDDSQAKDDSMSPPSSQPFSPDSTCRVEILEQPVKKVRFRYLSELQGTPHGPLLGERSSKTNKTYPKVRLVGYEGRKPVKMRCWLVDKAEIPRGEVRPHCHDLVVRKCMPRNEIATEPHEISISRENDFTAMFENMVVLHCVQKDSESKYLNKHLRWNSRDCSINQPDFKFDKKKIRDIIKSINKNEVYLYFEAYIEYPNSVEVLCHALSNPIKNLKNPVSGDLKICKVLNNFGSCEGNTEVGLFTEKVPPDVKIKFYRAVNMWEHIVSPEFMHRNVALTFRAPKLPFDIEKDTKAQFCLYRESDGVTSNVIDFTYQPSDIVHGTRKRRHGDVSSTVKSPPMDYANNDTTDDEVSNDVSFFGKIEPTFIYLDEQSLGSQIAGIDEQSLLEMINENSYSDAAKNWSGTSIENALGNNDPFMNGSVYYQEEGQRAFESDGGNSIKYNRIYKAPFEGSSSAYYPENNYKVAECEGFTPVPKATKNKSEIGTLLHNILLTSKYKDHVNCLQKALITDKNKLLKKLLSDILIYSKSPQINIPFKVLSSLPKIISKITDEKSQTLLHKAVILDKYDIIKALLDFGYDPLDIDRNGNNAFHMAATRSSKATLKALIDTFGEKKQEMETSELLSSTVSLKNFEGNNILHIAVRSVGINRSDEVVNYILNLKLVDINSQESSSGDSSLHIACRLGLIRTASLLIQNGANLKLKNLQGYAPIHLSVSRNDHEMVKLLVKEKSDPKQEFGSFTHNGLDDSSEENDDENIFSYNQDSSEEETYTSNDAFSLATDLKMIDILCNKVNDVSLETMEESKPNDNLLTDDQVDKLCSILHEKEAWRLICGKLQKPHITTLCKGFAQPERLLLDFIKQHRVEILGENDPINKLAALFTSVNLCEAAEVIIPK